MLHLWVGRRIEVVVVFVRVLSVRPTIIKLNLCVGLKEKEVDQLAWRFGWGWVREGLERGDGKSNTGDEKTRLYDAGK